MNTVQPVKSSSSDEHLGAEFPMIPLSMEDVEDLIEDSGMETDDSTMSENNIPNYTSDSDTCSTESQDMDSVNNSTALKKIDSTDKLINLQELVSLSPKNSGWKLAKPKKEEG